MNYRDIGFLQGYPEPRPISVETEPKTQVYRVTHDGAGNSLPYMYRSFISFTYGNKKIEEFDLIAIIEDNALTRDLSASFTDIVSKSDVTDGQFYWGTHYNNNSLNLTLFTDCITQKKLDEFKLWFQPGVERELILAENPFRGIIARVGAVSTMSMIPVEYPTTIKISGVEYHTSITKYQGSIHLNFVMDDPFWYSLYNVLDYQINENSASGQWMGIDENPVPILESPDALKVLYEDRIPTLAMFNITVDGHPIANDYVARGDNNFSASETYSEGSLVGSANVSGYRNGVTYESWVGLRENTITGEGTFPSFAPGYANRKYFYYAGTAPAYPTITFTLTVDDNSFNDNYFSAIGNEYISNTTPYSTITAEAVNKHELKITTPSYFTAYNQAVKILRSNLADLELEEMLRDGVHDKTVRDKAIEYKSISRLKNFIKGNYNFSINCKTGMVTMTHNGITKDAGDMIVSNMLKITERNRFDDNGYINYWENNKEYIHILYHDLNATLTNVGFLYRYMYF